MARPLIHIVCSDQNRNGKTLLARVLADFLLLEGRDPYLIDMGAPDGDLRNYFPGRTTLADFSQVSGQMKVFDTILASPGRPYVLDIPANEIARFCQAANELGFLKEARGLGFGIVLYFIVDRSQASLQSAVDVEEILNPDLLVPVRNHFVGSTLPRSVGSVMITMPVLAPEVFAIVANRRFSFRTFLLGEDSQIPVRLRPALREFLQGIMNALRDVEPALSLSKLQA